MTFSMVVPFVLYSGTNPEHSRSLFTLFEKMAKKWHDLVDVIYCIDSGGFLPEKSTIPNIVFVRKPWQSHWENLNQVLLNIQEEAFVLIDSDMLIYDRSVIQNIRNSFEKHDVCSITDNSGSDISKRFSFLKENKQRANRNRFAPYLFACRTSLFHKIQPLDCSPIQGEFWADSFGYISQQLLAMNPRILELPDDRTTVYFNKGKMSVQQWLDGGEYEWSKKVNPMYGYYHVRNAGFPLFVRSLFEKGENDALQKVIEITPTNEMVRLLTWSKYYYGEYMLLELFEKMGISQDLFEQYEKVFLAAHVFLREI